MRIRNLLAAAIVGLSAAVLLPALSLAESKAPVVVKTTPTNGATGVDPSRTQIEVEFSEPMRDQAWAWSYESPASFPKVAGQPQYTEGGKKNVLPVKLEPKKNYIIWLNTANNKSFQNAAGVPLQPYRWTFQTK